MKFYKISDAHISEIRQGRCASFRESFNASNFRGISLAGLKLTESNIDNYFQALEGLTFSHLKVNRCSINHLTLPKILDLCKKHNIKYLDLSANDLSVADYDYLFKNLGQIKKLSIKSNAITDNVFKSIAPFILNANQLDSLNLKNNSLSDTGFSILGELITKAPKLIAVYLNNNQVTSTGLDKFIEQVKNSYLTFSDIDKMMIDQNTQDHYKEMINGHAAPLLEFFKFAKTLPKSESGDKQNRKRVNSF